MVGRGPRFLIVSVEVGHLFLRAPRKGRLGFSGNQRETYATKYRLVIDISIGSSVYEWEVEINSSNE